MRLKTVLPSTALIVLSIVLSGCGEQPKPVEKPLVRVGVQEARLTSYAPVLTLTGIIAARTENNLAFRTGGRVAERLVDVGDHVASGQLLARLDPDEQQSDIRSAQAAVDAANAQLLQAQAAFQRQQTLLSQGFTTRADFDTARQAVDVATNALTAAQSQLQNARDALGYTELKADGPGVVTARYVESGQVVQAAQTVYTIAEDGGRDAVFNISENLLANPPPPQPVDVTLLTDRAVTARGLVREVAPVIDPASGTIRVKVGLDNPPTALQLGAAVAGSVRLRDTKAVLLPWQALFSAQGSPAVWVLDPAKKTVDLHSIGVLAYDTGSVAIQSGLNDGDTVVVAGGQLLRPGLAVDPVTEAAP